jgi:hypothetical protein
VNVRVRKAKKTIDDLSWTAEIALGSELETIKEISKKHWDVMGKVSDKVAYREIFIFTAPDPSGDYELRGRYEKFELRIQEDSPGYSCAYYEERPQTPLPQFMIIDDEEVVFLTDPYPAYFTVKHPVIVKYFKAYYEDIWNKAVLIKRAEYVHQEVVESIREKLAKNV